MQCLGFTLDPKSHVGFGFALGGRAGMGRFCDQSSEVCFRDCISGLRKVRFHFWGSLLCLGVEKWVPTTILVTCEDPKP